MPHIIQFRGVRFDADLIAAVPQPRFRTSGDLFFCTLHLTMKTGAELPIYEEVHQSTVTAAENAEAQFREDVKKLRDAIFPHNQTTFIP